MDGPLKGDPELALPERLPHSILLPAALDDERTDLVELGALSAIQQRSRLNYKTLLTSDSGSEILKYSAPLSDYQPQERSMNRPSRWFFRAGRMSRSRCTFGIPKIRSVVSLLGASESARAVLVER